jgi:hypothetical protein
MREPGQSKQREELAWHWNGNKNKQPSKNVSFKRGRKFNMEHHAAHIKSGLQPTIIHNIQFSLAKGG